MGQGDGSQHPGARTQAGQDDIVIDFVRNGRHLKVQVEQLLHLPAHQGQELGLGHHPAAQDEPLRREDTDEVDQTVGEVARLKLPSGMIGGQGLARPAPTPLDGRASPCPPIIPLGSLRRAT